MADHLDSPPEVAFQVPGTPLGRRTPGQSPAGPWAHDICTSMMGIQGDPAIVRKLRFACVVARIQVYFRPWRSVDMEKRRIRTIRYPLVEVAFLPTGAPMIVAPRMRFSSASQFPPQLTRGEAPEESLAHSERLTLASLSAGS
jgi:hypothetical protein